MNLLQEGLQEGREILQILKEESGDLRKEMAGVIREAGSDIRDLLATERVVKFYDLTDGFDPDATNIDFPFLEEGEVEPPVLGSVSFKRRFPVIGKWEIVEEQP